MQPTPIFSSLGNQTRRFLFQKGTEIMTTKVLAERIEENLEGMEKQLAKEVVGLEEVQKLQQVTTVIP